MTLQNFAAWTKKMTASLTCRKGDYAVRLSQRLRSLKIDIYVVWLFCIYHPILFALYNIREVRFNWTATSTVEEKLTLRIKDYCCLVTLSSKPQKIVIVTLLFCRGQHGIVKEKRPIKFYGVVITEFTTMKTKRSPKICIFKYENCTLCTRVFHFRAFRTRSCRIQYVKWPVLKLCIRR